MTARASFREKYEAAAAANDSLLCVGLDPDPSRLPPGVDIDAWLREVIEATSDLVCCYKPNAAFFEARGPHGQEALWALIDGIPDEIPVAARRQARRCRALWRSSTRGPSSRCSARTP